MFKAFAVEKTPMNNERLDLFFKKNQILQNLREQTDILAVHELYKVMTLRQYSPGQTLSRYGSHSDECFFMLRGKVERMLPEKTSIAVKTEEDLIKFYAENYD